MAACCAGEWAAIKTVRTPSAKLRKMAGQLTPNTGRDEKIPGLINLKTAHKTQHIKMLRRIADGMASLHHPSASLRTNFRICFGVAPRQRSIPKNSVRWVILVFRLLVIISTPARITRPARSRTIRDRKSTRCLLYTSDAACLLYTSDAADFGADFQAHRSVW